MRKICFSLFIASIILLMVSASFAQTPRQPTFSEGKSGFTNIAVRGLADDGTDAEINTGLPGYIEMTSTCGNIFYLYIGCDGNLQIASEMAVGHLASPALVGWSDSSAPLVSEQSR